MNILPNPVVLSGMNNYGRIVQKRVLLLKLEIASSNCVLDKYISIAHYHLGAAMGATNEYQWDPGGVRLKMQGYPGVLFVAFAINCVVEGLIQEGRCKSKGKGSRKRGSKAQNRKWE